MVYKDTLVISYTNYPSPYFISVYGLNSKKLLGECYKQGRGPGEMNDCGLVIKNSQVFAYEPGIAVSEMDIDKLISLGGDYEPVVVHIPSSFRKSFAVYDDSILVGSNDFYLDGYERSKDIPALLKIDLRTGMLIPDEDMRDLDFFAGPVSGGQVVNFKESNQIMLALLKRPCMKIFDRDLNLVKTIVGPDKDDIEFAENVMDGFAFIEEKENETSAFFIDSYATGNEIFVLNDRAYKCTYDSMINEVAKSQEVWVFDMKGDIKR
ncbi:MAG: hypothetical protein HUJ96_10845, partial [Marinilabiliaceae bacterium]|nr:hypothetical protein [Marinilabiliaceae bacterium]